MIRINQQDFTQKLAETYYQQSISFYTELITLQVKLDFAEKKIEELELRLEEQEGVNVNSTADI